MISYSYWSTIAYDGSCLLIILRIVDLVKLDVVLGSSKTDTTVIR